MISVQKQTALFLPANPQCACDYEKNATVQQERALENLSGWTFNAADLVLDIGSGNGKVTANMAKQVPYGKVVGLDIDPSMCSFATEKYPHSEYPNLEFVQDNACELNYVEAFNKITSFATLSWIPIDHHLHIFTGIAQALKPGGKTLLRMSAEGKRPFNKAVEEVMARDKWAPFFLGFASPAAYQSEDRLKDMLIAVGLIVHRIEDATKSSSFPTKEAFYNWLMTWEPHRNQVSESQREMFMYEVIDCYCETMNFTHMISITLPGILVEAEKPIKGSAAP